MNRISYTVALGMKNECFYALDFVSFYFLLSLDGQGEGGEGGGGERKRSVHLITISVPALCPLSDTVCCRGSI